jgi:hypothetical protein
MRKLLLIAAIALASTAANAGASRSLSLATADATPQVTEQPVTPTAKPGSTVERPQPVAPQTTTQAPQDKAAGVVKPRPRHVSTEARIIYELHRHGVYW